MLKFRNRIGSDEYECKISMYTSQGGIVVALDCERPDGTNASTTVLLTPMDAAFVSHRIGIVDECQAGHSSKGETLTIYYRDYADASGKDDGVVLDDIEFVGDLWCGWIVAGPVKMAVPDFVLKAIKQAIDNAMGSLMYPSSGDFEEEFG